MFNTLSDQRIRYLHAPGPMTIGAKRNELCKAAMGQIIAHFDDDDYYGPRYIEGMLSFMTDLHVAFVKLFGFFLYHRTHEAFAYWDLERDFPQHFCLHPTVSPYITRRLSNVNDRWGYGFSYVFYRHVWEKLPFPDRNHGEDQVFADAVVAHFKSAGKQDFACSCVHVIHTNNSSSTYPQQLLPKDQLRQLFPKFP
jgi:hypothetical protein